ncbi:phosphoribosyltransferase family protein [Sulfurovum sp.]|jgi:putative phosphoribosyl transferase|uniref:phosphoribosyltransferase n=1 Tax=Sulfurovum sp. TaxID=1969726 RepID=UPI002A363D12|nr:phosphoribosyltransferase family protein [Sulfurovum sp.]MDY0402410.1 phosphoribosyltransferase family protein [Sulfurovum sp.]
MSNDLDLNCCYFRDRQAAAEQLIDTLPAELFPPDETVVVGISEGGVYFADRVATALDAPMDILLTEAIRAPNNPELPIAMISETEEVVMHRALIDAFDISVNFVYAAASRIYEEEVLSYVYKYRKGKDLLSLKGKYVVLVDECIETGLTMMVALKSAIAREAKNIYVATPILDQSVYENMIAVCDGVFCPHKIQDYISIEYYFQNFEKLTFDEIVWMVERQEKKRKSNQMRVKENN